KSSRGCCARIQRGALSFEVGVRASTEVERNRCLGARSEEEQGTRGLPYAQRLKRRAYIPAPEEASELFLRVRCSAWPRLVPWRRLSLWTETSRAPQDVSLSPRFAAHASNG
ncbi:unnamed protein product, partial [Discosporangium mesarthrocarpum]